MPFLLHDGQAYFSRAFEFSRVFLYEWTVNWRFVPEKTFVSREFASALLAGHALVLLAAASCWTKPIGGIYNFVLRVLRHPRQPAFPKPMSPTRKPISTA
jgi:alpha-1,3-mannosyltransferase